MSEAVKGNRHNPWLECRNCLWVDKLPDDDLSDCRYRDDETALDYGCPAWTCAVCRGDWSINHEACFAGKGES